MPATRRRSLRGSCTLVLAAFLANLSYPSSAIAQMESDETPRPNIVLVMTDDQALGDLGFMGNPILQTPNTDALAAASVRFDRFYVSPVCAPTRASLMTGRYNYRTRVTDTWVGRSMMEPDEVTIAEVLKDAGYTTGIFGKWHLGDCYPMRASDQGFDESLLHRGGGLAEVSAPPENGKRYRDLQLQHNNEPVQTEGYITDVYTDAAIEFAERAVESGRPFFLYLSTNVPHDPFDDPPTELYEKYRAMDLSPVLPEGSTQADWAARAYAMIENFDRDLGRLLATLDRLGVADNTIVVYLQDNGPRFLRYNAGLRGRKIQPLEGGIRSPLLVRWPGHLEPAKVSHIAAHIDVMPTLLDLAGVPVPEADHLDGLSLAPLLKNPGAPWPDRLLFIQSHRADAPVPRHHFAAIGERWKIVRVSGFNQPQPLPRTTVQLFDLKADPGESNDLAEQEPEVLARMLAAYDAWLADVSSTRPNNYDPPRIVIGTDHETVTTLTHQDSRRPVESDFSRATWLLTAHGEHHYRVRLLATADHTKGTVTLRLGERELTMPVGEGRWTEFDGVTIPPGDLGLSATYADTDEPTAAYQIVVERQE